MGKLRDILMSEGILRTAKRPHRSERDDIEEQYADVPRNEQGELALTGLYIVRIVVEADSGDEEKLKQIGLVY